MAGSTSSKIIERSAQILRLLFSFLKASQERSFLNSWTLEGHTEGVEGTLLALVFLGIVLELRTKSTQQKEKETKTKLRAECKLAQKKKKKEQKEQYDA